MNYVSGSGVSRFLVASVQHLPAGKFRSYGQDILWSQVSVEREFVGK
jgi:hypothetical protein